MATLCTAFGRMRVSQKAQHLGSRANGIAASRQVQTVQRAARAAAPAPLVVEAKIAKNKKRAKLKTHKAAAKRFRISGSGKIILRHAGKQHLNEKMNRKQKKRLTKDKPAFTGDVRNNVRLVLPYHRKKISLKNQRIANREDNIELHKPEPNRGGPGSS